MCIDDQYQCKVAHLEQCLCFDWRICSSYKPAYFSQPQNFEQFKDFEKNRQLWVFVSNQEKKFLKPESREKINDKISAKIMSSDFA